MKQDRLVRFDRMLRNDGKISEDLVSYREVVLSGNETGHRNITAKIRVRHCHDMQPRFAKPIVFLDLLAKDRREHFSGKDRAVEVSAACASGWLNTKSPVADRNHRCVVYGFHT